MVRMRSRLRGTRSLSLTPVLAPVIGLAVLAASCGRAPVRGGGWVAAAEAVRPTVHSVWGSRPVDGLERTAFAPLGSAFALTAKGLLLTNAHVVAPERGLARHLRVLVQGDTGAVFYNGEVLAIDEGKDLAVVRIEADGLRYARWTEEEAPIGTPLATIGYGLPEGGVVEASDTDVVSQYTVFRRFTAGYSSGYRTRVAGDPGTNALEADLFLFPGVSGGPAFREDGRVVGVDRGHREYREAASSYGVIIPANVVKLFLASVAAETGLDPDSVFGAAPAGAAERP